MYCSIILVYLVAARKLVLQMILRFIQVLFHAKGFSFTPVIVLPQFRTIRGFHLVQFIFVFFSSFSLVHPLTCFSFFLSSVQRCSLLVSTLLFVFLVFFESNKYFKFAQILVAKPFCQLFSM